MDPYQKIKFLSEKRVQNCTDVRVDLQVQVVPKMVDRADIEVTESPEKFDTMKRVKNRWDVVNERVSEVSLEVYTFNRSSVLVYLGGRLKL